MQDLAAAKPALEEALAALNSITAKVLKRFGPCLGRKRLPVPA